MTNLTIKFVHYTEATPAIQSIRRRVFQEEQNVDPALEFDGQDETADHFLAYLYQQPVGTVRIRYLNQHLAKIERLAVLPEARGQGIGKQLMEKALELCHQKEIQEIVIHAQEQAKEFHKKIGFEQVGDKFYEADIPHIKMIKKINK